MILIIDNYDSFVYNLAQYVGELGYEPRVFRNDAISLEEIRRLNPSHIIISPGPGAPEGAGVSNDVIRHFAGKIPILGVCLGHQCIGYVFGGRITRGPEPVHGKSSPIFHNSRTIFKNLPNPFEAGRYHSLVINPDGLPEALEVSAWTDDGIIMGVRHKEFPLEGVQFHPESVLTSVGHKLLENFLNLSAEVQNRV